MNETLCTACGETLRPGDWPFCPHGASQFSAIGDEFVGGFVQTNFGHEPEVFYSKKAMLKRADELGLQPFVKHSGAHETQVTNWAAGATEKQLRDAAVLLSRGSQKPTAADARCATLETSIRELTIGVRVPLDH